MKNFRIVYQFEIMSYIKNKAFMLMTILLAVLLGLLTFLPRVVDMSEILGTESMVKSEEKEESVKLGIVDSAGCFMSIELLEQAFPDAQFIFMNDAEDIENAITERKIEAGFFVKDTMEFDYYVLNLEMNDRNQVVFTEIMSVLYKQFYCANKGIDYITFVSEFEKPIQCNTKILGKNALDNYLYCYVLVVVIVMVIVMYGAMIATSVTTEKSNRSIEVLVTSIDAKYLLFGKVFAGVTAVAIQIGLILGSALLGYSINHSYWGNRLDMLLHIPISVLGAFILFGIGGFLFYAFLYGAMGALVSRTEDINKTTGPLQIIIMLVYFAVLFQIENTDGLIMKISSFLPISSYAAMFVRIGMGQVEEWEIILSAVILFFSTVFVGWLSASIYRMGTLRYGNPIKLTKALKDLLHNH